MNYVQITDDIIVPRQDIEITAIRSQGAGGQNVNKVSTGIHLRFDVRASSLPEFLKTRLCQLSDRRVNKDGIIIIKSQQSRSQEQNRIQALHMLQTLIQSALMTKKQRKRTRPSKISREKRLEQKKLRSRVKELRQKIPH